MEVNHRLYDLFRDKAETVTIEHLAVGLGYTGVVTSDGGMGIAYTFFESKQSCTFVRDYCDYEKMPAIDLLEKIQSKDAIQRGMALALINALNYDTARQAPEDIGNMLLFEKLGIGDGTKVAMVGHIGPLVQTLRGNNATLSIIDDFRGMGDTDLFFNKLENWAEVLILSATTLLNSTTETILTHVQPTVKTMMIGPSTPMVVEAFAHLPIHILAGMVPLDRERAMKAVRFGMGTPTLKTLSRKCYLILSDL